MSVKYKVYCTYANDWDIGDLNEEIEFKSNPNKILTREELLCEIKGCHGIVSNPKCPRIDAEVLDAAGNQLKVHF